MMKVCLINLVFFCLPGFFLHKATLADTSASKAAFSGTVPARGLSGQQQFDRALAWFTHFHAASFQEIEVGDPALGVLRAMGSIESHVSGTASRNVCKIHFTVMMHLVSGAYRYELRDFRTVPFKKGRYCPERKKSFDISSYPLSNNPIESRLRCNRSVYREAERIAKLISISVQQTLAKN